MEVAEVIIYFILTFITFILIGVMSWVTYDYYKFKEENEKKLVNTFARHRETDDTISKDIKNTSNILVAYSSNIALNSSNYINEVKINTSNFVTAENKKSIDNTANFNNNLSKYFKFGTDSDGIGGFNNKLYEYTTWDPAKDSKIELINETTAAAGLRLKTTDTKGLNICDDKGEKCYNLYVTGSNLHIKAPEGGGDVKWGNSASVDSFVKKSDTPAPVVITPEEAAAANAAADVAKTAALATALGRDGADDIVGLLKTKTTEAAATPPTYTKELLLALTQMASAIATKADIASANAIKAANAQGVTDVKKQETLTAAYSALSSARWVNETIIVAHKFVNLDTPPVFPDKIDF